MALYIFFIEYTDDSAEGGRPNRENSTVYSPCVDCDEDSEINAEIEAFENSVTQMQYWAVRQIIRQKTSEDSKLISTIYQK